MAISIVIRAGSFPLFLVVSDVQQIDIIEEYKISFLC